MSIKIMSQLWENSRHDGTHLLVLMALADWANDDGEAYPAVPTLARKCRISERRLQQILEELTAKKQVNGIFRKLLVKHRTHAVLYAIRQDAIPTRNK